METIEIEQGNWRAQIKRPSVPIKLFYRLRRIVRRRIQLVLWAMELAAEEAKLREVQQLRIRNRVQALGLSGCVKHRPLKNFAIWGKHPIALGEFERGARGED